MKKLFILAVLLAIIGPAHALIIGGASSAATPTSVLHAQNLDNGSGTNVVLNGTFQGSLSGEVATQLGSYFATNIAATFTDGTFTYPIIGNNGVGYYDAGPGFYSGENIIWTNQSGIIYNAFTNGTLYQTVGELPLGTSGQSRYGLNLVATANQTFQIIAQNGPGFFDGGIQANSGQHSTFAGYTSDGNFADWNLVCDGVTRIKVDHAGNMDFNDTNGNNFMSYSVGYGLAIGNGSGGSAGYFDTTGVFHAGTAGIVGLSYNALVNLPTNAPIFEPLELCDNGFGSYEMSFNVGTFSGEAFPVNAGQGYSFTLATRPLLVNNATNFAFEIDFYDNYTNVVNWTMTVSAATNNATTGAVGARQIASSWNITNATAGTYVKAILSTNYPLAFATNIINFRILPSFSGPATLYFLQNSGVTSH